jgi:hypothetical protein
MIVEDDMQMSLEEFARRYGREDGEPEYVPACAP